MNLIVSSALKAMPDSLYLRVKYFLRLKKVLHLKNPKTFNEKLQWLKLYERRPLYTQLVDKYEARSFISDTIGEEYLIGLIGVYDKFEDIPFDQLPDQFVLKCTHDSGGLVICRDKSKLDIQAAKVKIEKSLRTNYYWHGREWPYRDVKPRIICEVYMEEADSTGLTDYKFFCFNHEPKMLYVSRGLENHNTAQISFYDLEGYPMPFKRTDYAPIEGKFYMPENFDELKALAKVICVKIPSPFVRVDLYSINGKIYASEITFSPCSGFILFDPPEWDEKIGEWVTL